MGFPPRTKLVIPQRDFSGGQINADAERRDDLDLIRAGGRQARNIRPVSTGQGKQRPGRRALHSADGFRNDYFRMTPTARFKLGFSAGKITIYNTDGTVAASNTSGDYLWGDDDVALISWTQASFDLVFCYPLMQPQIARYDRSSASWTFKPFEFRFTANTSREPFYRSGALGATMQASARSGSITLTCSADYFNSSMIGSYISILGQQVQITAVSSATVATGTVLDKLPALISWSIGSTGSTPFEVGELVTGSVFGRKAEVIYCISSAVLGWMTDSVNFYGAGSTPDETVVSARSQASAYATSDQTAAWGTYTVKSVQWQEQFMGPYKGWPARCAFAQDRLVLFDFPQMPEAVLFSAIGQYDQFWIDSTAISNSQSAGATPTAAILEFLPKRRGKPRVMHVVDVGDLLIFTDKGTWQVPISTQNPLKPGSMQFIDINADAVSNIPPVSAQDLVFYVNAGLSRVSVIRATGQASRSFSSDDLSEPHSNLFKSPVAMALETGDDKHPERMLYVVNGDGTLTVGRQTVVGEKLGFGWFPWDGGTTVSWVSVGDSNVIFTEQIGSNYIVSQQDDDYYLDSSVLLSDIPAELAPPLGLGDLWWMAGETATLMSGLRDLGERAIDASGNIVTLEGDDLTDENLVVGLRWTWVYEPFIANMQAGVSQKQRQNMRRIPKVVVTVKDCTGFECQGREIAPYFFDEDTTIDPPLRAGTYKFTTLGRSYDPSIPITKSRPGPITLVEVSTEATV